LLTKEQRWAPALFRAREREAKKSAKTAKAPNAKEKNHEFSVFPTFAEIHWKPGSRAANHWAGGNARGVYAYPCCFAMLHVRSRFCISVLLVYAACPKLRPFSQNSYKQHFMGAAKLLFCLKKISFYPYMHFQDS
jgi:hypothetical protein